MIYLFIIDVIEKILSKLAYIRLWSREKLKNISSRDYRILYMRKKLKVWIYVDSHIKKKKLKILLAYNIYSFLYIGNIGKFKFLIQITAQNNYNKIFNIFKFIILNITCRRKK